MFKFKKPEYKTTIREGELVSGMNALNLPEGTILKVLNGSVSNIGDIIIRTDSMSRPFRALKPSGTNVPDVGNYWGSSLDGYKFQIMYGYILNVDFPQYYNMIESERRA